MATSRKRKSENLSAATLVKNAQLLKRLWELGWLAYKTFQEAKAAPERVVSSALIAYQATNGLPLSGQVCPRTERSLNALRMCGHPDVMPFSAELNRWPDPNIRWWLDESTFRYTKLAPALILASAEFGFEMWRNVCGILPARVNDRAKAHVVIEFGQIDGPGKVLAYSELADNTMRVKSQKFDGDEAFAFAANPPAQAIDAGRVFGHEIGHVLGIGHLSRGCLMQSMYDPNIRLPQAGDVQEGVQRYGPPLATTPAPTPAPTPQPVGNRFLVTLEGTGDLARLEATGFKVTRVA